MPLFRIAHFSKQSEESTIEKDLFASVAGHSGIRTEVAGSSEYAICTNRALLNSFGEGTSWIIVRVGDTNDFRWITKRSY